MTISIDFNSPVIRIPGYETKYDFAGASNSLVRFFDNYLQARIVQQFHFWLWMKNGGVVLRGVKWIYKALKMLQEEAIVGFSEYQVRKAISILLAQGILIREQLHREHHGGVHARAAYNRQYYYRLDYDALELFIQSKVKELKPKSNQTRPPQAEAEIPLAPVQKDTADPLGDTSFSVASAEAESTETMGFVKVANLICDLHETDLRISQINTDTTFRINPSNTHPDSHLEKSGITQEKIVSQTSQDLQREQELVNPNSSSQKAVNPKSTPFTDVVARPPRVEQKINKAKPVLKVVQKTPVQENVQNQKPEAAQVEVMPPKQVKPSDKRKKTPKGTKPLRDFGLAPWTSLEQFQRFYRALVSKLSIVANSRSPQGLAHQIINQLKQGVPHSYWDDFVNGLPIGTSTQQEWEVEPGVPHPMFIEYLAEKLIKGNNTQTREQAVANALNIVRSPQQAIFFWKEFKISLDNALHEAERHRQLGVKALSTPLWTKERPEPTIEEAAIAGTKIALINSSTKAVLEAAQNRQIEGSTRQIEPSIHLSSNTSQELDPWLDEEKPKKSKLSDYASEKVKALLSKGSAKKPQSKSESVKKYAQPDEWRRQPLKISEMKLAEINKALIDPILRGELTPQLMLSDYELITDEMGRIISVEKPPE